MSSNLLYWNAMDFGSDETVSTKYSPPRNYIDPWDLENYAYIRRYLDVTGSVSSPSAAGEPTDISLYHTFESTSRVNGYETMISERGTSKYAGIDEYDFRNEHFERSSPNYYYQPFCEREDLYGYSQDFSDMDQISDSDDPLVTDGSLLYMYETATRYRKMAVPSLSKSYSTHCDIYGVYEDCYSNKQTYCRSPLEDMYYSSRESTVPIYDDLRLHKMKPNHFSLSNYGHLKIDYSCSWSSLGKYIEK